MTHYNVLYIRNGDVIFIIILNWNEAPSFSNIAVHRSRRMQIIKRLVFVAVCNVILEEYAWYSLSILHPTRKSCLVSIPNGMQCYLYFGKWWSEMGSAWSVGFASLPHSLHLLSSLSTACGLIIGVYNSYPQLLDPYTHKIVSSPLCYSTLHTVQTAHIIRNSERKLSPANN